MIMVENNNEGRLSQGDIIKDIEYIESVTTENGIITVDKIIFPLVIVLTQDCDLALDQLFRNPEEKKKTNDKYLLSVLVAPLYNAEHLFSGEHLSDLGYKMEIIPKGKTRGDLLQNNQIDRYHYIEFPEDINIVPSTIDFKHYFSIDVKYLQEVASEKRICRISPLFRESISQRFANYLSRIGLPEIAKQK